MARLYPFYPAHSSNYSNGRERPIKQITVHHSAGWEQTLRYLWANPSRNGSSHFWVGNKKGHIEQYVDTANTAWTNGSWTSNNESITIETRGDWRGFYDEQTLLNLRALIKKILQTHPNLKLTFHMDVTNSSTLCPADLKHKGYARKQFNAAVKDLLPPAPVKPSITYRAIKPKRIELKVATNLWDFSFTKWGDAKKVKAFGAGHVADVVAIAKNSLGAEYYMTAYSYNNGKIRATSGFNVKDAKDYVPPAPVEPPKVYPTWEAMLTPRKMRVGADTRVTNLDTGEEFGDVVKEGTDVSLVEKKTTRELKNGKETFTVWVRSEWAKENDKNWGMKLEMFTEVPPAPEEPPTPEPEPEPVPEPPIDIDPNPKPEPELPKYPQWITNLVYAFFRLISAIFNKGDK